MNATVSPLNDFTALEKYLQQLLASACAGVFQAYSIAVAPGATEPLGDALVSQVHFAGKLSGRLTLTIARDPVIQSLPIENGTDDDYEDWCRELTNQIMGLIKNGLLEQGLAIKQSLPTSLNRRSCPPPSDRPISTVGFIALRAEYDRATVQLEAVTEEALPRV